MDSNNNVYPCVYKYENEGSSSTYETISSEYCECSMMQELDTEELIDEHIENNTDTVQIGW